MRSRGEILLRAAAWALLLAVALPAQVRVRGRVVDENNAPVAAAAVEFRDTWGQGLNRAVTSDETGRFEVELPAPGAYSLRASKDGFFLLKDHLATLSEGANSLTVTLNHLQELVERVDVVYSPPAIDPVETSEKRQLNSIQILEVPFPASQDFRNALPMFPGVVKDREGQLHFNGGNSDQTSYTLDGFNIADIYSGALEARVSIDAIRALDLTGSRFSPEKGSGSAGALEIVTGMGDDRLRFGATNFIPGVSFERGPVISKWTPRLTVSGPLAKGRAWFHNGFEAFYDVDTIHELPPGEDRSRSLTTGNLTRFQWNASRSHILTGDLLVNLTETNHYGLSFLSPMETTVHQRRRLYMGAIKDQFYLPQRGLFEFGFAVTRGENANRPQGDRTFLITPSGFRGNNFNRFERSTAREQWMLGATLPVSGAGSHEWRLGLDVQRSRFEQISARHDFRVLREDGTVARWVVFGGPKKIKDSNLEAAIYARDRWQIRESLVLSLGLRADRNEITRGTPISPRLSASWSPAWLKGTKASAGFGIYNDALNLDVLTRSQDQAPWITSYTRAGAPAGAPTAMLLVNPEQRLRIPRARVYSLGLERMLAGGVHLSLSYTRKRGWDGLAFGGESCGQASGASVCVLSNRRRDRYDALETTLRSAFGGRFEWLVSYVYSQARANAVVDYAASNPMLGRQAGGPVAWDTPHRLLAWGWSPLPASLGPSWMQRCFRDMGLASLVEARSGFPFSVYNEEGVRVGAVHDRRFPVYFNVNLHVEKKLRMWGYLWAVRAGFNNLTNHGNPNVVNSNIDSPSFLAFGGGQRRATNVRLRLLGRK